MTRRAKPIRLERVGRPENQERPAGEPTRDPTGVELRDLYNREDAFALSTEYRPLYESRSMQPAFFDGLDDADRVAAGSADGRHPMRDLLIDDFLVLDLARSLRARRLSGDRARRAEDRPHTTAGGRWLDDDILDEMLTWLVNGGRGERLGDGVDAPTGRPA